MRFSEDDYRSEEQIQLDALESHRSGDTNSNPSNLASWLLFGAVLVVGLLVYFYPAETLALIAAAF